MVLWGVILRGVRASNRRGKRICPRVCVGKAGRPYTAVGEEGDEAAGEEDAASAYADEADGGEADGWGGGEGEGDGEAEAADARPTADATGMATGGGGEGACWFGAGRNLKSSS